MTDPATAQCAIYRVKSNILPGSASIFRRHDDNMLRIKPVPLLLRSSVTPAGERKSDIACIFTRPPYIETNRGEERIQQSVFHQRYGWKVSDRYSCRHRATIGSSCDRSIVIYAWYTRISAWYARAHTFFRFAILKRVLIKCHKRWETRRMLLPLRIVTLEEVAPARMYIQAGYNNSIHSVGCVSSRKSSLNFPLRYSRFTSASYFSDDFN